jgi:hypothetical protein
MSLTPDQIQEALRQMISHTELAEANDYEMTSARGALYTLGYTEEQADEVIDFMAAGGFTNCLDPRITGPVVVGETRPSRPTMDVCYWGPDQLRSRIHALSNIDRGALYRHGY